MIRSAKNGGGRRRPRLWLRLLAGAAGGVFALAVLIVLLVGAAALGLSDGRLALPNWATARIEDRLNAGMGGGHIALGRVELALGQGAAARISLRDVRLSDPAGGALAQLNDVSAAFDAAALLRGDLVARRLRLDGAQVTVRRMADGGFRLSLGAGGASFPGLGGLLDATDAALDKRPLDRIEGIEAADLTIALEDARTGRVWQMTGGHMALTRTAAGTDIAVTADIFNGTDALAGARLSISTQRRSGAAEIAVTVRDAAAADIALQSPVLAALAVLDAPISGAFRTRLDAAGQPAELSGKLEIGAGALRPVADAAPVGFDHARAYFSYRADTDRITLSEVSVRADVAQIDVAGQAYLRDRGPDGWPRALLGQIRIGGLTLDQRDLFPRPLVFTDGALDARLRLDPFTVEIGQLVLTADEGRRLRAEGRIGARPEGWSAALDLSAETLAADDVLALWPLPVAARTRQWLSDNVSAGRITRFRGALRQAPGTGRTLGASFDFQDATARFLPDMPPLTGASGSAAIQEDRFGLTLTAGQVTPETGGPIDLAGSTMTVPDLRRKPAQGIFRLRTDSSAEAVLSLLSRPPVNLFRDGGRVDLAQGRAELDVNFRTEFRKRDRPPDPADLSFDVTGELTGLSSDVLVPGRLLKADALRLRATPSAVLIEGDATLDDIPVAARWRQGLTPEEKGRSELSGTIELSERTQRTLGLGLPDGLIGGSGSGAFRLSLVKGAAPSFRLTSDLDGLRLSLPAIGWTKPAHDPGRLTVEGRLGDTPAVSRLELAAAGLTAGGRLDLGPGGTFRAAVFDSVKVGAWLDAPVRLVARKGGSPGVELRGGMLDLRRAPFSGGAGGGAGAAHGPIELALDRLVISDGLALAPAQGRIDAGRGLTGSLAARLNGGTAMRVSLVQTEKGPAARIQADDAGGVFRDAGLLRQARGGSFDLTLQPTGARGTYDGLLRVAQTRVQDAPAMAELLSAISVVGLLEQLDGQGIPFETVQANFRLTPERLTLYRSSAVGASLGISLDGVYDLGSKNMDMQGVLSPVYILNGIGQFLTRRGEGLFGFNFRLTGPSSGPSVRVNPLSILTPGMFREIFRRPPPERN
jgi:hypothetical protein